MIDRKLQEYAIVLQGLFGSGVYLQRILAASLTLEEQEYLTSLIVGESNPKLWVGDGTRQPDSIRRAKSRLLEKLDSIILANQPTAGGSRRVDATREAFAHATTAAIARRFGAMTLAKHKLQAVARGAVPPDMYEIRLFALRMLLSVAAHDANNADFIRYKKELDRSQATYRTITAIDEVLRYLILENMKKYRRAQGLQTVAMKALDILCSIDLKTCDPIIVVTGCTLATAVAQIVSDKDLADSWLAAYLEACTTLDLWDDAHKRDWLLQQIFMCEYFGHHKGMTMFSRQLVELTKSGTERWFQLMRSLSLRALQSNNIKLSLQLTMDAVMHPRFRRQRLNVKGGLLCCAGYAAVISENDQLYQAYNRRRKQRDIWIVHYAVIDAMYALNKHDLLGAMTAFEHALRLFASELQGESISLTLRSTIIDALHQLRTIETLVTERVQRAKIDDLRSQLASQILPIVTQLI